MSTIVWILLGLVLGFILSKIVSTTGEGTVVDILLGIVGAVHRRDRLQHRQRLQRGHRRDRRDHTSGALSD